MTEKERLMGSGGGNYPPPFLDDDTGRITTGKGGIDKLLPCDFSVSNKVAVGQLFRELQQSGVIGLVELRNIIYDMFPDFGIYRDTELDEFLVEYISHLGEEPYLPNELPFSNERV